MCGAVNGFDLFVVAFYDLRHVINATVADLLFFLLKILAKGL